MALSLSTRGDPGGESITAGWHRLPGPGDSL